MLRASIWQWGRYKEKTALLATYKNNSQVQAIPFPFQQFSKPNISPVEKQKLATELLNKKISIQGKFDFDKQLIVTNRKDSSGPGHHLLAPFKIKDSDFYIMISRGFIPFGDRDLASWGKYNLQKEENIFAVVKKNISPNGILGPQNPEVSLGGDYQRIWYFQEIDKMAKQLPYPLITDVFLQQLNPSSTFPKEAISIEVPPSTHFGYTFEWIILAIITQIIAFLLQCFNGKRFAKITCFVLLLIFNSSDSFAADPAKVPDQAAIKQNLETQLDLSLNFRSQKWEEKQLKDFFLDKRPTIFAPVYYDCPRLCSLTLEGLAKVVNQLDLKLNKDYKIIVITINPNETPESAKKKSVKFYKDLKISEEEKQGAVFLTGSPENIKQIMNQLGFEYFKDGEEYAHSAGVMITTPGGKISRYFMGIEYPLNEFKYSLIEASQGRIGTLADHVFLFCFRFDPTKGIYSLAIWRVTQVVCGLIVFAFGIFLLKLWKKL